MDNYKEQQSTFTLKQPTQLAHNQFATFPKPSHVILATVYRCKMTVETSVVYYALYDAKVCMIRLVLDNDAQKLTTF